jgi:hypothetical protein
MLRRLPSEFSMLRGRPRELSMLGHRQRELNMLGQCSRELNLPQRHHTELNCSKAISQRAQRCYDVTIGILISKTMSKGAQLATTSP